MRKILKKIISKSRILKPLRKLQKDKIIIFNYHRILDDKNPITFNESVFETTSSRFIEEIKWLKKETRILSEDELIDIVYNKKPINELCTMITFDDGYQDHYNIAYPILKEMNIPGIFFIPTKQIDERQVGWWDLVAYFFKNTKKTVFYFNHQIFTITDTNLIIRKFNSELKNTDANLVDNYLIELSESLGVPFPSKEIQSEELMTWDQIRIMSDNGMTIGSHSHDHTILSKQDKTTLKCQLKKASFILESKLNKKIQSISYPVGGYDHFNECTKEVSREIGLKLGFSYLTGINQTKEIDPFDVKRMSIRPEWINLDIPLAFPNLILKETPH